MKYVLYGLCAVLAYLLSSFNPAIALSRAVYHTDIRTQGSGNPGFTNFRRVFGARYAWVVFLLDIGKGLAALSVAGLLLTTRYMSLSTMAGLIVGAGCVAALGAALPVCVAYAACVAFVVVRHRENIRRLLHGNETKFRFGHS